MHACRYVYNKPSDIKKYSKTCEIHKRKLLYFSFHPTEIQIIAYLLLIKIKRSFYGLTFFWTLAWNSVRSWIRKSWRFYKQWWNMTAYIFKWRMLCYFMPRKCSKNWLWIHFTITRSVSGIYNLNHKSMPKDLMGNLYNSNKNILSNDLYM